jgi:signal peptidase II
MPVPASGMQRSPNTEPGLQIPLPQKRPDENAVDFPSALRRYAPLILVAAMVFVVDQWTKASISAYVDAHGGTPFEVLGGKVLIDLVHNTGAAFGLFPNQTILFVVVAVVIVTALIVSYRRLARGPIWLRIGLGLVLGGALGNLSDRVRLGYVIDFVDVRWWPVFNLADSCIVAGVLILILTLTVQAEKR